MRASEETEVVFCAGVAMIFAKEWCFSSRRWHSFQKFATDRVEQEALVEIRGLLVEPGQPGVGIRCKLAITGELHGGDFIAASPRLILLRRKS